PSGWSHRFKRNRGGSLSDRQRPGHFRGVQGHGHALLRERQSRHLPDAGVDAGIPRECQATKTGLKKSDLAASAVFSISARVVAAGFENGFRLLLVEPAEKFLEALVGADFLHSVEVIAQFVVRPSLVDKILAAVARGRGLASALAARHHV